MKTRLIAIVIIALIVGGLYAAMRVRAPKPPRPTTAEIWNQEGIPVDTARVIRGDIERTVEVTGDIAALNDVVLSSKIPGRVARVYLREGDRVGKGQTIVLLDQEDALSGLQQAMANLQSARARLSQAVTNADVTRIQTAAGIDEAQASLDAALARLDVARNPARSQERMVAENDVASAKANLDNAEANYKRHQQLLSEGAISQAAFDIVDTQRKVAQAQHKSASQRLSMIEEGGRSEEVRAAQAQVDMAKERLRAAKANASQNLLRREDIKSAKASVAQAAAGLALAQQQLANTYIKSPIDGILSSRSTEPGQVVAPGQALGEAVNLGSLYFKGDISEKQIEIVRRGQSVRVTVDAVPGVAFQGVVDEVYPAGSQASRNFPARIRIISATDAIRPGMFARGRVVTGMARGVLLVPKDAVEERSGAKMVFTVESRENKRDGAAGRARALVARRHDIEVVNQNARYAQVRQPVDLRVGDEVVTRGRQNLQNGLKLSLRNGKRPDPRS